MSTSAKADLDMDVQYLRGVGPRIAESLRKLGIVTARDLLYYLPFRYEDRSSFTKIRDLRPGAWATVKGRIISVESRSPKGNFTIIRAAINDKTGTIALTWFNQRWVRTALEKHHGEIIAYGQVKEANWGYEISSPEWEAIDADDDKEEFARITPIYRLTEGLAQKSIRRAVSNAVALVDAASAPETLPKSVLQSHKLRPLEWCLREVHFPASEQNRADARRRLVFEEFLSMQLAFVQKKTEQAAELGIRFEAAHEEALQELQSHIPFSLTSAQNRVIGEIFADMRSEHAMSRLVQGDVGSGKTLVAAAAMLAAVRSGYQAVLMAPTEILAEQHYINLHRLFASMNVDIELLVGKQTATQKKKAVERARSGAAQIAVGTHALIQEGVEFAKLGFVVVDEQHRFGVLQRAALRKKGYDNPDVLVMTATPIPRSLTLTLYGDLDLSVIDEMPPGRKAIRTHWKLPAERPIVYRGIQKLLQEGAQAYIVCPLVSESEKMLAQAATETYKQMSERVFPDFRVGLLHGQLKAKEKEEVMEKFRAHELDILVSTTVIEVGVDVANASVMLIEDANRFGLAQLHQLRGRVGRGERQSFCILVAAANSPDAEARLRVMIQTTDGFRIAEEDLRIRGPGEMYGTRQSGELELRIADLLQDGKVLEEARGAALRIIEHDPRLQEPEHAPIRQAAAKFLEKAARTDVS